MFFHSYVKLVSHDFEDSNQFEIQSGLYVFINLEVVFKT